MWKILASLLLYQKQVEINGHNNISVLGIVSIKKMLKGQRKKVD